MTMIRFHRLDLSPLNLVHEDERCETFPPRTVCQDSQEQRAPKNWPIEVSTRTFMNDLIGRAFYSMVSNRDQEAKGRSCISRAKEDRKPTLSRRKAREGSDGHGVKAARNPWSIIDMTYNAYAFLVQMLTEMD